MPPYSTTCELCSIMQCIAFGVQCANNAAYILLLLFLLLLQGHEALSGVMSSVALAANDPAFILHHSFVDKLFEMWIRKYEPGLNQV